MADGTEQPPRQNPILSAAKEIITPAARGLSQALMQGAFEQFGQAFTDTGDRRGGRTAGSSPGMEAFREAGARTADAMANRWHAMEWENFDADKVQPFVQNKRNLIQEYERANAMLDDGQWIGPDGAVVELNIKTPEGRERALRKRNELTTKFYNLNADMDMTLANDAIKYPGNPIIEGRILGMFQATSSMLQNVASPPSLPAEAAMSEIRTSEKNAETSAKNAETAATSSKVAAARSLAPRDIQEALVDPNIGPQGILPWLTTGQGREILASDAGKISFEAAHERVRQSLLATGQYIDDGPGGVGTEKLNAKLAMSGQDIASMAAVAMLKQAAPAAVDIAKQATPQFFTWEKGADGTPAAAGILGEKRRSKADIKETVKAWQGVVDAAVQKFVENPNNPTTPDAIVNYIVNEYLPKAIVGQTEDNIPVGMIYAQSAETSAERQQVMSMLAEYVKRSWAKSSVAKELNPIEAAKVTSGPSGLRGRRLSILAEKRKQKGLALPERK